MKLSFKQKIPKCIQNYEKFIHTSFDKICSGVSNTVSDLSENLKIKQSQDLIDNKLLKSHFHLQTILNIPSKQVYDYFGSLKSHFYHTKWSTSTDSSIPSNDLSLKSNLNKLKKKHLNFDNMNDLILNQMSLQKKQFEESINNYNCPNMINEAFYDFNFEIAIMEDLFDVKIKNKHIKAKYKIPKDAQILNYSNNTGSHEIYSNVKSGGSDSKNSKFTFDLKEPAIFNKINSDQENVLESKLSKNLPLYIRKTSLEDTNFENHQKIHEDRTIYSFKDDITYTQTINQEEYQMVKVGSISDFRMSQFDYTDSVMTGKKSVFVDVNLF